METFPIADLIAQHHIQLVISESGDMYLMIDERSIEITDAYDDLDIRQSYDLATNLHGLFTDCYNEESYGEDEVMAVVQHLVDVEYIPLGDRSGRGSYLQHKVTVEEVFGFVEGMRAMRNVAMILRTALGDTLFEQIALADY